MPAKKKQQAPQITLAQSALDDLKDHYLNGSVHFHQLALGAAIVTNDLVAFKVFAPLTRRPSNTDVEYLYKMLRHLIAHKADTNAELISETLKFVPELKTHRASDGATLLHTAAFHNGAIANLLVREGFDMSAKLTDGTTTVESFVKMRQQVKGSTVQTATDSDKALLNLSQMRVQLFLGLYKTHAADQDQIGCFQNTLRHIAKFLISGGEYYTECTSEVLIYISNIHSLSKDLKPLQYFCDAVGEDTLVTIHKTAIEKQQYDCLYELYKIYGLLSYKYLEDGAYNKAIEYTNKVLNTPPEIPAPWKPDFAQILHRMAARWFVLDHALAHKLINTASTLDQSNDEIKMLHLIFCYEKADIDGLQQVMLTFDLGSNAEKIALAEYIFLKYGTSREVFEHVFSKVLCELTPDDPSLVLSARSLFYSRLLEYYAIRHDDEQFTAATQKILENLQVDFGLIVTSALSAIHRNNGTDRYCDFLSNCFDRYPEYKNSVIPTIRFVEFYCKLRKGDMAAVEKDLVALQQWSLYQAVTGLYNHAKDLYLTHKIDDAIGRSAFDEAVQYANTLHDTSIKNKYLTVIKICQNAPNTSVAVDNTEEVTADAEVRDIAQEVVACEDTSHTPVTNAPLSRDQIFEALRLTSGDDAEYEELIALLSPADLHQYYTQLKTQVLHSAIDSCTSTQKITTWRYNGAQYKSDNPDVVHINGTERCYATIDCTQLDKSLYDQFKAALDNLVSKVSGANGIKYIRQKCVELKINGDNRLWTTEELVNQAGDVLLVFNHHGNHEAVSRVPCGSLHTIQCIEDVQVMGDAGP